MWLHRYPSEMVHDKWEDQIKTVQENYHFEDNMYHCFPTQRKFWLFKTNALSPSDYRASATHDLGLYDIVDESFRDLNGGEKPGSDGTFAGQCLNDTTYCNSQWKYCKIPLWPNCPHIFDCIWEQTIALAWHLVNWSVFHLLLAVSIGNWEMYFSVWLCRHASMQFPNMGITE